MSWVKLEVDIFEHCSHHNLLVADYFSRFPVVKKLTSQTASHVISLLKTIFAEYGIPATAYADQGTQFMSKEFKEFALQYRFQVQHSSLRYPQSNGFIEAMVKLVKSIMERAEESGSDPHLAMLIYRATPVRPSIKPSRVAHSAQIQSPTANPSVSTPQSRDKQGSSDSTETNSS